MKKNRNRQKQNLQRKLANLLLPSKSQEFKDPKGPIWLHHRQRGRPKLRFWGSSAFRDGAQATFGLVR